jgi:hypothetical protein
MRSLRLSVWMLMVGVITGMLVFISDGVAAKKAPPPAADDADDTSPDVPLPKGIKERVFIHLPKTHDPSHLGTCTVTGNDDDQTFDLGGWRLPDAGIIWKLNTATIPRNLNVGATTDALIFSTQAWSAADPQKHFEYGGSTGVTRARYDGVNAVVWGKVSGNAIAVTYVRYHSLTGVVVDVDMVFNSRLPWANFVASQDCETFPDAYDVQNIATHEFGHWIGLEDLYTTTVRDLTMYGYGAGGELKKRSLGVGDALGAQTVAP